VLLVSPGDGKSRTPASARTINAKMIKIQMMTAVCGIVLSASRLSLGTLAS
jgi:hypothetical protein